MEALSISRKGQPSLSCGEGQVEKAANLIEVGLLSAAATFTGQFQIFDTAWRCSAFSLHCGDINLGTCNSSFEGWRRDFNTRWWSTSNQVCYFDNFAVLTQIANLDVFCRKISEEHDKVFVTGCVEPDTTQPKANAAFVVLARNKELEGVIQSIKSVERHFNRWYHYPYVFLNDGDFNETFKATVVNYTSSPVEFGKIDPKMWGFPDWIDPKVAKEGIAKQGDEAIMYGGMESYHAMCRFYSGYVKSSCRTLRHTDYS